MRRRVRRKSHSFPWALVLAGLVVAAGGWIAYSYVSRPGAPAQWAFDGARLTVSDSTNQPLWSTVLPRAWRTVAYGPGSEGKRFWFGDLDGDGKLETLAAYHPVQEDQGGSGLYCFSNKGETKWFYQPGRKVWDASAEYSTAYVAQAFRVIPAQVDRPPIIVLVSNHATQYPSQVAALDTSGRMLTQYWHSGALTEVASADLNRDGKDDLLVAGVDEGRQRLTLILLDPEALGGASVEEPGDAHQLAGFASGNERIIVWLPMAELTGMSVAGEEVRLDLRSHGSSVRCVFDRGLNLTLTEGDAQLGEQMRQGIVRKAQ